MARLRVAGLALLSLVATDCAHSAAARLGPRYGDVTTLAGAMREAGSPATTLSAEARVTTLGPEGRRRATVVLAARRPNRVSYQVLGPHGGLIEAFATDGREMQLYEVGNRRFLYGPATPANLDLLLGGLSLGFDPAAWAGLFFGEIVPGPDAALRPSADDEPYRLAWHADGVLHQLEVDPATLRPSRVELRRGDAVLARVEIRAREAHGLPTEIDIDLPTTGRRVRIELGDFAIDPALGDDVFRLDPPAGAALEHLGTP